MVAVLLACVGLLSGGRAEAAQGGLPQCIAELAVCHTQLTAAQGDLAQGTNDLASTDDRFVDNGDGTITDNQTGLMWEKKSSGASTSHDGQGVGNCLQCVDDTYPWAVAMSEWLSALNGRTDEPSTQTGYAGHSDWRLPTFVELQTITVPSGGGSEPCVAPIFNTNCMPGCTVTSCSCTEPSGYWSSTTSDDPSSAWLINFEFCGDAFLTDKSVGLLVRAVRRAQ